MRTTLDINDELLRQVKRRAADEGTSLRAVIESALRSHIGRPRRGTSYRLHWRTEKGRVRPGVRIDYRDGLFDRMEDRR
jgi:hypothetical protein